MSCFRKIGFSFIVGAALSGCATTAPQTKELLASPPKISKEKHIEGVPFIDQKIGECGPASLAMAMSWAGRPVAVDTLAQKVMTTEKGGSLQENLVGAARREGLMAVQISGLKDLLTEVDQGHPVIIFENLGLSWYQQWHYAVVTGYDLPREDIVMHSGHDADSRTDLRVFERSWKLSDYWALVILPAGDISTSAGELANMRAAAGLEMVGRSEEAQKSYERILKSWPESMSAMIGLGNLAYARGDYKTSVKVLRQAHSLYPDSEVVQHNLKVAEAKLGAH